MDKTRQRRSTGERLLNVLESLTERDRPLTLPELTQLVDLPKPTVHRLVGLLESIGYVVKDPAERRLVPGPALHRLALHVIQNQGQSAARHAILKRLADSVSEACNLVLLDGDQLVYVDRVDTAWPLRLRFEVGSHVPLHCTASGKLLLALQPPSLRDRLISNIELEAYTPRTITSVDSLRAELQAISRDRTGQDDQEFIPEMAAVSVPVETSQGFPVLALSIHAPTVRRSIDDLRGFVPRLREAAAAISEAMDWTGENRDREKRT